jgi:hypothetical protein
MFSKLFSQELYTNAITQSRLICNIFWKWLWKAPLAGITTETTQEPMSRVVNSVGCPLARFRSYSAPGLYYSSYKLSNWAVRPSRTVCSRMTPNTRQETCWSQINVVTRPVSPFRVTTQFRLCLWPPKSAGVLPWSRILTAGELDTLWIAWAFARIKRSS